MAKKRLVTEMSVQQFASTVGKGRGTIYRWIEDRENGLKSKLPKNVTVKKVIGRVVLVVK